MTIVANIIPPIWEELDQKLALPCQRPPVEQGSGLEKGQNMWGHPTDWMQAQMIWNPVPRRWWEELRSIHRKSFSQTWPCPGAATHPMTDPILLAVHCPGRGIRLVGGPMQSSRVRSLRLLAPQWFLQYQGFLREEEGGDLGTGPSSASLCREVGDASWSPVQYITEPSKCMEPLMCLEGDEIVEVSLIGPTDDGSGMSPTLVEEAVLLGHEPVPQEPQEATMCPCEHPEVPEPEEPATQSDTLCLPAPSAAAPSPKWQPILGHQKSLVEG